jgi:uncharacterized NAD(P)/FAD-binding protein YdhS
VEGLGDVGCAFCCPLVRPDECRLGLDVTRTGALLSRPGRVSSSLFAHWATDTGCIWDITAIPVIRRQAEILAQHLASLMREQVN